MKCECGEFVEYIDSTGNNIRTNAHVYADIKRGKCKILKVMEYNKNAKIGESAFTGIDLLPLLSTQEIETLEDAMLSHNDD